MEYLSNSLAVAPME